MGVCDETTLFVAIPEAVALIEELVASIPVEAVFEAAIAELALAFAANAQT